jgi:hypothetical protein
MPSPFVPPGFVSPEKRYTGWFISVTCTRPPLVVVPIPVTPGTVVAVPAGSVSAGQIGAYRR